MKYFFTADTHFNHQKILEYDERPFRSIEHMDREIIRRWNERVKPEDVVIHLGDFGFLKGDKTYTYYRSQLNGNLIHVEGNHDNNNSMNAILQCIVVKYGGLDWWCEHRPSFRFKYNLCGHVHNLWKVSRQGQSTCINVGVSQWDYYPITIDEILRATNIPTPFYTPEFGVYEKNYPRQRG